MTRALSTAQSQQNSAGSTPPFVAGKNKLINGGMDIWQRGTSFNVSGATQYGADRFYGDTGVGGVAVLSRQTFTPGNAPVAGYENAYFYRWNQTTAGSNANIKCGQRIEDIRTLAGQIFTISFWAKCDASKTFVIGLEQNAGSGGSGGSSSTTSITIGTSWTRYSYTGTLSSLSGVTIGTNSFVYAYIKENSGFSTFTLDVWGFQVEAGSQATPFTTATGTLQGELAACQRYYVRFGQSAGDGAAGIVTPAGLCSLTTRCDMSQALPVTMRTVPTVLEWGNLKLQEADNNQPVPSALSLDLAVSTNTYVSYSTTHTGGTANMYARMLKNTSAGYIAFSAEL